MSPMQTMNTTAEQNAPAHAPCGCGEQPPAPACCCNLVCFDRPNYFCGHLLTDADLTLQQKYVVEKNKLYHRALDGHGVVCGLKLTCDCDCKGHIRIHDGYAIDDCGNDLVVCETTRFDVIGALKRKKLLLTESEEDDCEPRHRMSRCDIKQCFYVTLCYDETESDYETPFQSACTAGPKQCLPTRTHEGVRFDVTPTLPPKHSYLDDIERRVKECFEINCESPIGAILKENAKELLAICSDGEWEPNERFDPCELFCTLRAYFLNHLRVKPDQFNCGLLEEVSCLRCPGECRQEEANRQRDNEWWKIYRRELQESFGKLIYCMQRYQYDCVFGDLIFSCQQPCEAHCLVLGTVEVVNGKLVRVCNTPREYLWAPANWQQVLHYEVMTGKPDDCEHEEGRACCCPSYQKFDPCEFLREFEVDKCGRRLAATAAVDSFRAVAESLHHSFDFTDSMAYSPRLFEGVLEKQRANAKDKTVLGVGVSVSKATDAAALSSLNLSQAFQSKALLRRGDAVVGYKTPDGILAQVDFLRELSPDRSVGAEIATLLLQQKQQMEEFRAEIDALKKQIDAAESSGKAKKK